MGKKKNSWLSSFLAKIPFVPRKKKKSPIRRVFFGIRARWMFLLGLLLFATIGVFTLLIYLSQSNIIAREKEQKARALTDSLSSSLQWHLDVEQGISPSERTLRRVFISNEINRFMDINPDILHVYVYNREKNVVFSLQRVQARRPPYAKAVPLLVGTNEAMKKDFVAVQTNEGEKTIEKKRYRLHSSPILAQFGDLVSLNRDFDTILVPYHKEGLSEAQKKRAYQQVYSRYSEWLPTRLHFSNFTTDGEDITAWSLNNLFLEGYKALFNRKGHRLSRSDRWLVQDAWMAGSLRDLQNALERRNVGLVKATAEKIFERLSTLRAYGERFRFLGNVVVVYDLDQIESGIQENLSIAFVLALVIYIISMMAVYWVAGLIIRRIKTLERWALEVSNGNLSVNIHLQGRDEIGRLSDAFQIMLEEIISKYHLEKFVSRSTRSMIEQKSDASMNLGSQSRRHFAFIFSDIRGFTAFSEENDPELVIKVLNSYFERQTRIIRKYRGDIDDFVGDQIMAHFGGEKRVDSALQAAMAIMEDIEGFNNERKKTGLPIFEIGIGVHIGDVVVGNIGSQFRMDFACIGDAVNTASRLCSQAGSGEILASKEILDEAQQRYKTEALEPLHLKGKKEPFSVVKIFWKEKEA